MITQKQFVDAWMEASRNGQPLSTVAAALHVNYKTVCNRAYRYREWGVNLPKLVRANPAGTRSVDVDELNKIIEGEK